MGKWQGMNMPCQEENLEADKDVIWHRLATRLHKDHSLLCCMLRAVVIVVITDSEQELEMKKKVLVFSVLLTPELEIPQIQ